MKEMLAVWTLETLESDPIVYGGDNGNPAIMVKYLQETSTHDSIALITYETMSNAVSVSRLKNQILLDYPELDCRTKNKPKDKETLHPNQGVLFDIRDFVSESENKILSYLEADQERWNYPVSRIKKSIRGADDKEIECVLRHKKLYQMETQNDCYNNISEETGRQKLKDSSNEVGNNS